MSLREQIAKRIIKNDLNFEVRMQGTLYSFKLPEIEPEFKQGRNRKVVDSRMQQRADQLADQQMQILAS